MRDQGFFSGRLTDFTSSGAYVQSEDNTFFAEQQ
jgi:hypothetical protein